MSEYCKNISFKTVLPAIVKSSKNGTFIQHSNCSLNFSINDPKYSELGLIITVNNITLKNNKTIQANGTCKDFILIKVDNSTHIKWCNQSDLFKGKAFPGVKNIEIVFHTENNSQSNFEFVVTPFESKST